MERCQLITGYSRTFFKWSEVLSCFLYTVTKVFYNKSYFSVSYVSVIRSFKFCNASMRSFGTKFYSTNILQCIYWFSSGDMQEFWMQSTWCLHTTCWYPLNSAPDSWRKKPEERNVMNQYISILIFRAELLHGNLYAIILSLPSQWGRETCRSQHRLSLRTSLCSSDSLES